MTIYFVRCLLQSLLQLVACSHSSLRLATTRLTSSLMAIYSVRILLLSRYLVTLEESYFPSCHDFCQLYGARSLELYLLELVIVLERISVKTKMFFTLITHL